MKPVPITLLLLLALAACDTRPVAEEEGPGAAAAEALQQPLERARSVDELNRQRTAGVDEAVEADSR